MPRSLVQMTSFAVELLAGLSTGSIYALLAIGLTLIYQVSGMVNFAQGAFAAVGAYILWGLLYQAGYPFWIAAVLTAVALFCLGSVIQAAITRRLEHAPASSVIVTLGLLIVLEGALGWRWGYQSPAIGGFAQPLNLPLSPGSWTVGTVNIAYLDVVTIGTAAVVIGALYVVLRFTRHGMSLSAVSQSTQGARLVGIDVSRVRMFAWGVSAVIACAAGVLIPSAKFVPLNPTMVEPFLLNAFAGAVVGGLDSLFGAALGALLIGVVQNLVAFYTPTSWVDVGVGKDTVVFLLLLAVLMVRPSGVFGTAVQSRV